MSAIRPDQLTICLISSPPVASRVPPQTRGNPLRLLPTLASPAPLACPGHPYSATSESPSHWPVGTSASLTILVRLRVVGCRRRALAQVSSIPSAANSVSSPPPHSACCPRTSLRSAVSELKANKFGTFKSEYNSNRRC